MLKRAFEMNRKTKEVQCGCKIFSAERIEPVPNELLKLNNLRYSLNAIRRYSLNE